MGNNSLCVFIMRGCELYTVEGKFLKKKKKKTKDVSGVQMC